MRLLRSMIDFRAQSVARLTQEPEVLGSISVRSHTFVSLSADSRRVVVSY